MPTSPSPSPPGTNRFSLAKLNIKFPPQYRYLFVPTVIITVIGISLPLLVAPQTSNLIRQREAVKANQAQEAVLVNKLAQLQSLDEPFLSQVQLLTLALPTEKAVSSSFLSLSQAATQNQLQLTSLKLSPGLISTESAQVQATSPEDLKINLTVEGETRKLEAFLSQISKLLPLMSIEELGLSSSGIAQERGNLRLVINSHWAPLPDKLPPVDTPLPQLSAKDQETLSQVSQLATQLSPIIPESPSPYRTSPFSH